jgi:cell division protease FtsH
MIAEWDSLQIDYQFREKTTSWLGILLSTLLPWIVFIAIWIYFMRRMQGGGTKGVFSFGKSKAKLSMEGKPRVTFDDVAGCDEAKEELQEVIAFLRDPKKFSRLGGRIPKGALLLGPPGTGKTLLARAVAGEAEVAFFTMSGADFVEMFVGVGAARVRDLFETGKKHAPCIIFIDEIDAVGRHRGAGLGGGHDEREQTLNQLLVEMDGFESNDGVILIAATNRPDVLDPALTRPGRFDRQIVVDRPDVRGREGILKVHSKNIPLSPDVKLGVLAKGTPGLAGADLANLVNEAALLAARRNATQVSMDHFEEAKDKVMMGAERRSMLISEDEKRQTAYHEAGHVLVAKMSPGADPVHKVTIIPRGRALGLTHYLPIDEKHNYSRNYLWQSLTHLLGGRVAEKIVFNEFSTGAGNDIERATDIARRMVCEWGMSDRLGPIAFGRKQEEIFLGREISQHRDFSERTAQEIDTEVRRIVTDAERRAEKLIRDNLEKLKVLAEALLDREILDGDEIDIVLKGGKLPPIHVKQLEAEPRRDKGDHRQHQRHGGDRHSGPQFGRGDSRNESRRFDRQDQRRPDNQRQLQSRPETPRQDAPRPPQGQSDVARADVQRPQQSPPEAARPDGSRPPQGRPDMPRTDQRSDRPRERGHRGPDDSSKSPGKLRREFARSYGVVSSRDPENQRPTPSEIAKMQQRQQQQQQQQQPQQPPPVVKDATTPSREPLQSEPSAPEIDRPVEQAAPVRETPRSRPEPRHRDRRPPRQQRREPVAASSEEKPAESTLPIFEEPARPAVSDRQEPQGEQPAAQSDGSSAERPKPRSRWSRSTSNRRRSLQKPVEGSGESSSGDAAGESRTPPPPPPPGNDNSGTGE